MPRMYADNVCAVFFTPKKQITHAKIKYMKVQKVEIKNFKAIDHFSLDLGGRNVYVIGANAKGKTSFIDACFNCLPGEPLKQGESRGEINIDLGPYKINYTFNKKNQKPKLSIIDENGTEQKTPATLLKELFGVIDWNIDDFLKLSATKQVDFIKNLCGIDWSDIDASYKELFEERAYNNKKYSELEKKQSGEVYHQGCNEKIDISKLTQEIEDSNKTNAMIEKIENGIKERDQKIENSILNIHEKRKRIAEIESEINEINDSISIAVNQINDGKNWLSKQTKIDTSLLSASLNESIDHNTKFDHNEKIVAIRKESTEVYKNIEHLEKRMQDIQDLKKSQLEQSTMPVPGLTFEDDQLYLNGIPFKSDQINTAKKIITGLQIQLHFLKDVKIVRFDGSLLDYKSMNEVIEWSEKNDVQIFVEIVEREKDSKLHVEIIES